MEEKKFRNTIEFQVSGDYALFSEPVTRVGGEKSSYREGERLHLQSSPQQDKSGGYRGESAGQSKLSFFSVQYE